MSINPKSLYGRYGTGIEIHSTVSIIEPGKIFFGDHVKIERYSSLKADHKIDYVQLDKEGIFIGENSRIGSFTILESVGGYIQIGKNCSIKDYCLIYGTGGVTIGDDVMIAAHSMIIAENHKFNDLNTLINQQGIDYRGIEIGDDVWIGAGCQILDGVKIGSHSVIGAGTSIRENLPEYSLAYGNPAKIAPRNS